MSGWDASLVDFTTGPAYANSEQNNSLECEIPAGLGAVARGGSVESMAGMHADDWSGGSGFGKL
jgi:hypothetical protein